MRTLGIDFISVFNLPPPDFANLAADLGCQSISLTLYATEYNPYGFPQWSLRTDRALREDLKAVMAERKVVVGLGEGLCIHAESDVRDLAPDLEIMAELGVTCLNTISFDPDMARTVEQVRLLADMGATHGITVGIEFTPSKKIRDFATGVETVRQIDRPNVGLVLDTMHFARSGSTLAQLKADPDVVKYVQLCDTRLKPWVDVPSYIEEARFERLIPGEGDVQLAEILAAAPRDVIVSVEVPRRSLAQAGASLHDMMKPVVDAARALVAQVDAHASTVA